MMRRGRLGCCWRGFRGSFGSTVGQVGGVLRRVDVGMLTTRWTGTESRDGVVAFISHDTPKSTIFTIPTTNSLYPPPNAISSIIPLPNYPIIVASFALSSKSNTFASSVPSSPSFFSSPFPPSSSSSFNSYGFGLTTLNLTISLSLSPSATL